MKPIPMKVFAWLLFVILAGCGSQIQPLPVTHYVPYRVYCEAKPRTLPHLPIADLKPDATAQDNQRAWVGSVTLLKQAVRLRDDDLATCRKP